MTGGENPFGELMQDYIVECLPLAEQVGDVFVELERMLAAPASRAMTSSPRSRVACTRSRAIPR